MGKYLVLVVFVLNCWLFSFIFEFIYQILIDKMQQHMFFSSGGSSDGSWHQGADGQSAGGACMGTYDAPLVESYGLDPSQRVYEPNQSLAPLKGL